MSAIWWPTASRSPVEFRMRKRAAARWRPPSTRRAEETVWYLSPPEGLLVFARVLFELFLPVALLPGRGLELFEKIAGQLGAADALGRDHDVDLGGGHIVAA